MLLANCTTAHCRNGYWHGTVICLSVYDERCSGWV